jgi:hypothetical protein
MRYLPESNQAVGHNSIGFILLYFTKALKTCHAKERDNGVLKKKIKQVGKRW